MEDLFPNRKEEVLDLLVNPATSLRGMHDTIGEVDNSGLSTGFDWLSALCGRTLDLWSCDLGYSTHPNDSVYLRYTLVDKAKYMYDTNGALVTISWHMCSPTVSEPCTWAAGMDIDLNSSQWTSLLTNGQSLNTAYKARLDYCACILKMLEAAGVPVLFRPLHEINGDWFWWSSTTGSQSAALWVLTHDYLTITKGLKNLIWVWSMAHQTSLRSDLASRYPGDAYVDVLGIDVYPTTGPPDYTIDWADKWNILGTLNATKPRALTECAHLPTAAELVTYPWCYIVPWGREMIEDQNSEADIIAYGNP